MALGENGVSDFAEVDELIASFSQAAKATLSVSEAASLEQMLPHVYEELRQLAGKYLRRERPDHTLQPTALVHEAYLRLLDQRTASWQNRAHLLAISARIMRRILLNHAEARGATKRGGGTTRLSLDLALDVFDQRNIPAIKLHAALRELETLDPRQGQIVELRFFGGLSIEETAEVLGISPATVKREWAIAKLWLERELAGRSR
jgi:RNA polymerase sigma factor (TIGR02999 family)